jgi:pimeloyl-ACP methyl ester carboxylesterase
MPFARVNGIDLFYREFGAGPALVLAHGLACGWRMWWPQIERLRRDYRVVVYDMRGHGRSGAPDDPDAYSAALLGQDLAGLLDHLAIERCHVVGFSMGGGPAIALALGQPKRVARMVLADVGSGAENPWAVKRLAEVWSEHARLGGMDAMADNMLLGEFFKTYARRSKRAHRHMRALITQNPLHGICHILAGVLARRKPLFRMRGTLARIGVPTLVLAGEHDHVCHKAARLLASTIPGAVEARVPGAGHMTPLEAPDEFSRLVQGFIGRP